jgi:ABC-type transport system involved in multi-copper enzyme maturation permease subunit
MTIVPVFKRELVAIARRGREPWSRSCFALILLASVLATFTACCYWETGNITNRRMALIAERSFLFIVAIHSLAILDGALVQSARCVAEENDRRTLDFLLGTRLSNAEIILGKFAARMAACLATACAGLPVVLMLNRLGGVDGWVILLACAGIAATSLFLAALSILVSTTSPDSRSAVGWAMLWMVAWLWLPFTVAFLLPRLGLSPPGWISAANAWLLASSPIGLLLKMPGMVASRGLVDVIARMCGLQVVGGLLCLIGAIVRLRAAHRAHVGGEAGGPVRKLIAPAWRSRPRPAVGDDPILWRERYTGRPEGPARLIHALVYLVLGAMLACPTYVFGWPALGELWHHGYAAGLMTAQRPEFNLAVRLFVPGGGFNPPPDLARVDFNLYLRFVTVLISFFLGLTAAAYAAERIVAEHARETWSSLIATPLAARDILRGILLGVWWRLRRGQATLAVLWTLGLITGAIHPLGFVATLLALGAWTWFLVACGLLCGLWAKGKARATEWSFSLALLLACSAALPFALPARFGSVLLGAGSPPFVIWLAQISYRDVRNALHYPAYPHLDWIGIATGEGPLRSALTCLLGILAPTIAGLLVWRYAIAQFDRLVGRPWREDRFEAAPVLLQPEPVVAS